MTYIGVDGCKAGWFSVELSENGNHGFSVHGTFESLWNYYINAAIILVDIPIGLPYGPQERNCDLKARQLLGKPRSSSVFPTPCREAVQAKSYNEASVISRQITNRGLSWQAWNISNKIYEVDNILQINSTARKIVREVHPEVLFWALNGHQSMQHHKSKAVGFSERLSVIEAHFPNAATIVSAVNCPGVAKDDIVDALAAAVTAYRSGGNLLNIPEEPQQDLIGLPMEMVYWTGQEG
ncbi:MAG: DUF429 domain-containing protein [Bacillota bacterium]|nr:DUF429 domain-containing protein [Bacillota bacterium]